MLVQWESVQNFIFLAYLEVDEKFVWGLGGSLGYLNPS